MLSTRRLSLDGHPGREVVTESGAAVSYSRRFVVGPVVYDLEYRSESTTDPHHRARGLLFLESFRLLTAVTLALEPRAAFPADDPAIGEPWLAWTQFTSPEATFSALLPGAPERRTQGKLMTSYSVSVQAPFWGTFSVSCRELRSPTTGDLLDAIAPTPADDKRWSVVTSFPLSPPDRGIEETLRARGGTGLRRLRRVLAGSRVYRIEYATDALRARHSSIDVNRFLGSLRPLSA